MSKPRLGQRQLDTLSFLGSPSLMLLTPTRSDTKLLALGLVQIVTPGTTAISITPAGLRHLASEMEAGRVKDAPTLAAERRAARH